MNFRELEEINKKVDGRRKCRGADGTIRIYGLLRKKLEIRR